MNSWISRTRVFQEFMCIPRVLEIQEFMCIPRVHVYSKSSCVYYKFDFIFP